MLLAFGKFDYLGWHGGHADDCRSPPRTLRTVTPAQAATLKFMLVAALLFLAQALIGGARRALSRRAGRLLRLRPVGVAAEQPAARLALCNSRSSGSRPHTLPARCSSRRRWAVAIRRASARSSIVLFGALVVVVVGSLLGQWAGINNLLGDLWFWIGNQGWEYLEIGRFWQILLAAGLLFWFWLVLPRGATGRANPELRPFVAFFLIAAFAIPFFYLPAFFFGDRTHFSIVDVWRFWIIHLWVEGFFEFFVTVDRRRHFLQLGMVRRITALRVIYLDAILYFGGGLDRHRAPLVLHRPNGARDGARRDVLGARSRAADLLTLDAWDFYRLTQRRGRSGITGTAGPSSS